MGRLGTLHKDTEMKLQSRPFFAPKSNLFKHSLQAVLEVMPTRTENDLHFHFRDPLQRKLMRSLVSSQSYRSAAEASCVRQNLYFGSGTVLVFGALILDVRKSQVFSENPATNRTARLIAP